MITEVIEIFQNRFLFGCLIKPVKNIHTMIFNAEIKGAVMQII